LQGDQVIVIEKEIVIKICDHGRRKFISRIFMLYSSIRVNNFYVQSQSLIIYSTHFHEVQDKLVESDIVFSIEEFFVAGGLWRDSLNWKASGILLQRDLVIVIDK